MNESESAVLEGLSARYGETYRKGEVIFREGEKGEALHIVVRGGVELSAFGHGTQRRVLRVAGPGQILGETSVFGELPHAATATAAEDTVVLRFPRAQALDLVRESPQLAVRIIEELGDRLRATTAALLEVEAEIDQKGREMDELRRRIRTRLEPWQMLGRE